MYLRITDQLLQPFMRGICFYADVWQSLYRSIQLRIRSRTGDHQWHMYLTEHIFDEKHRCLHILIHT